jgi:hypothetical protein
VAVGRLGGSAVDSRTPSIYGHQLQNMTGYSQEETNEMNKAAKEEQDAQSFFGSCEETKI